MTPKKIKTFILIVLLFAFCFTLSACDPSIYHFTSEDLAEVINIELINYDNPEQKSFKSWVPDHTSDLKSFNSTKTSRLEMLGEDKTSEFLDNLCECNVLYKYFAYDSPNGICLKLNYSNGDFLIIWSDYKNSCFDGYIGRFTLEGEVAEFLGCFDSLSCYKDLVNNYFTTQI